MDYKSATRLVETAKEQDLVIQLNNIGAVPYLRYSPYTNNQGVVVNQWACISMYFEAMPAKALVNYPHIVRPWEHEDWEINQIFTPWVVHQVVKHRKGRVKLKKPEDTPFAGDMMRWSQ